MKLPPMTVRAALRMLAEQPPAQRDADLWDTAEQLAKVAPNDLPLLVDAVETFATALRHVAGMDRNHYVRTDANAVITRGLPRD